MSQNPPPYMQPGSQYHRPPPQQAPPQQAPQQMHSYPGYGQQPFYGPPVYQPAPARGLSITSLVLGLVSVFFGFTFLVPLAALIFGLIALKKEPAGRGFALTGTIIGAVFMIFWIFMVIVFSSFFMAMVGSL
ncbi:MAG TPA: DUF4190 domain-containing protein [Actinomycetales bacterium]|nr:DUF4190 domain-containing protein [Actinomycetales bacterium]